ncbi:ZBTB8OS [Symbiodinium natans]|uniref:Protein archease-like n=1 Tax=Symbiodinium natans TaxID=878477 RepID=A0A812TR05_9DINO|nr:ZBTB8OS [Symbiodinium natans]
MAAEVPQWLAERFPGREWQSLRCCKLVAKEGVGAGLEMEATEYGYAVDTILPEPGQEPALQPGDTIVAIEGQRLLGLSEEDIDQVFGAHFRHGALLLLLSSKELQDAAGTQDMDPAESDKRKSVEEHEATVRIPVGRATAWQLDEATAANVSNDLAIVSEQFGLAARAHFGDHGMESVLLTGLPSAIAQARPEVVRILAFYRDGQLHCASEAPMEAAKAAPSTPMETTSLDLPDHVRDLRQFQYHDHTADIIVHAWGTSLAEALAQVCAGMFNYMTPLDKVGLVKTVEVEATGHDLPDLLYHLLDEFLYVFATEMHVSRCIEILSFDEQKLRIRARGYGEKMDLRKHEQGTEIKAITMHMMKILTPDFIFTEDGKGPRDAEGQMSDFAFEAYVLLDI